MQLFGTDGVRGKAGVKLTAILAMKLAMAAGIYFRKTSRTNKIIIGKDTRRSGYMIENAIVCGLTAVGYDVRQIGPMPTPAVSFLTENLRCDAGIMISASHNSYEDNGIKFFDFAGNKLNEEDERAIEKIYFDDEIINKNQKVDTYIGSSKRVDDVIGRYIVHIKYSFPKKLTLAGMRIVLDTANGAAYKVAPTIFRELGADIILLHNEPDGKNINEECGATKPKSLAKAVKEFRADVGFAFDGDADRLVVVDENANVIDGDKLLGVIAVNLKNENKLENNQVVATLMSNQALEVYLKENDIELLKSNIGDKYVLEKMQQNDANFGGENSGHIIFSDYVKTGDALVSALKVVTYLLQTKQKASVLLNPFELYPQKLVNLKIDEKKELSLIEGYDEMMKKFKNNGVNVLIRYSGTENILRVMIQAKDEKTLKDSINEAISLLKKSL